MRGWWKASSAFEERLAAGARAGAADRAHAEGGLGSFCWAEQSGFVLEDAGGDQPVGGGLLGGALCRVRVFGRAG
jgi:hypothetical protein